jgi:hypothetical protein
MSKAIIIETALAYSSQSVYGREIAIHELDSAGVKTATLSSGIGAEVVTIQSVPGTGPLYYRLSSSDPIAGNRRVLAEGASVDISRINGLSVLLSHVTIGDL